jgi:hypothetical protein
MYKYLLYRTDVLGRVLYDTVNSRIVRHEKVPDRKMTNGKDLEENGRGPIGVLPQHFLVEGNPWKPQSEQSVSLARFEPSAPVHEPTALPMYPSLQTLIKTAGLVSIEL